MIIEIEGIDGVGKTTQVRLLKQFLEENGHHAIIVKDLESTEIGRRIKEIFISDSPRDKTVELFGFLCCKAHLFSEVVAPVAQNGTWVICDRGFGSFISYFESCGFERQKLEDMLTVAVPKWRPAMTILLDLSAKEAIRRNIGKPGFSKFDNMGTNFFTKQRAVYSDLSSQSDWRTIDARASIDDIHQDICKIVDI